MDINPTQAQAAAGMLKQAMEEQQKLGGKLIASTVDQLHSGMKGMTPMIEKDYLMQKSVLNAAYSERGIGTKLDEIV